MFYKAELQKKNAIKLDQKLKEYGIPEFMWKFFRAKIKSKAAALKYLSMIKNFLLYTLENNLIQKTEISTLEPQDFNNIMAEDITEYLEIQEMNGVSPTTLNTKKNVLRSFWNYLARLSETNIDRDFFEDVTYEGISSSNENVIEKFPLQSELDEMESKILKISNDFTRNRNLTIFNILKGTGLRKSELIGLDIQNVCLNAEIPYIKVIGKGKYREENIVGLHGQVVKTTSGLIAVQIDGMYNAASSNGLYWFKRSELDIIRDESEDNKMTGFSKVAIVNLVDDYNKKDYGFALYDEDINEIVKYDTNHPLYLIVNARGKDNRVLGILKEIKTVKEYGKGVTAQVVGVVNMNAYNARIDKENRQKEIAKQKASIEKELKSEIEKMNNIALYEKMAKEHPENPRLAELVSALKELGE